MATTTPTVPDERTPLLCCQQALAVAKTTEQDPDAVTLIGPSNPASPTSSLKQLKGTTTNAEGGTEVVKKTPLPWIQFSITLFLQLAEPLSGHVISPVSSPVNL